MALLVPTMVSMSCIGMRRQSNGAVAFEFLILFPFVISLIYAAGVYGVLFSWQVRMQVAVDRSTAAVMALDRSSTDAPGDKARALALCALSGTGEGCTQPGMVPAFMGALNGAPCGEEDGQLVCKLSMQMTDSGCEGDEGGGFSGATGSGNGPKQLGFFEGFPPLPDCLTAEARVTF